ncbi:MAG: SDR family oxidoreductase [Thermodesulfobacteriota bacterium]
MNNHNNYIEKLFNLGNKVVLITGATGQLGHEICMAYYNAGSKVIGADKVLSKKKIIADNCVYIAMDVCNKDSVLKSFEFIYDKYGRVDILINNAGVSCFEPYEDRTEESFDWVMDVNLKGTFFCIQEYSRMVKERNHRGNIVNIASIYGLISPDFRIYTDCNRKNSEVYGATKAGIIQMTRYFAVHLADYGINVNCVSPGGIFNPEEPQGEDFVKNYSYRNPMGRMANAGETIGAILYLSSEAASYTTGQNIAVDGGMGSW